MATPITDSSYKNGLGCSICLDGFSSPRQLPCLHSFCEHCLQDYITRKASSTDKTFMEFICPVCRAVTRPAQKEKPVREWASLFPNSPFSLVGKSKVERSCEVCLNSSDNSNNLAKKFCIVCEKFMCDNCAFCHQNTTISKSHQIITLEELENNPANLIRLRGGFGCLEHDDEDIKLYCGSHETACCGTCYYLHHKDCQDVDELNVCLPDLLKDMKPHTIMARMRKLEDQLKHFMEVNEENIGILESYVNSISEEIGGIRKKLNDLLDDIEKMVKLEGTRIYKECVIRKQEQNHQCQSLLSAIKNSQALLETVDRCGSDTKHFVVISKTMKQLQCYSDQIREKFERVDTIRMKLELDSNMKAVLSKDAVGLVKIVCQEEAKSLMMPLHKRTVELSRVIDVHCPSHNYPWYMGIVQLPNGYIVLADWRSKTCCLFDSSYNFITSHILAGNPRVMCQIGDNEVAVTVPSGRTVQFLSIRDQSIRDTGTVTTKYICFGVDAVSREEILVSGICASKTCYWEVITRNGNVKLHHEFDCQSSCDAFAALDMSKSRVYIAVSRYKGAVYCFGLTDGKQYFVYLADDLKNPMGVAVDIEDNIYVLGWDSNNIHKLSPDGVTLQVITSRDLEGPQGISFNYNRDHFVVTHRGPKSTKLHYFVHE